MSRARGARVFNAGENYLWRKISKKAGDDCSDCRPARSVKLAFPQAIRRISPPPGAEEGLLSVAVPPSTGHHVEGIATLPAGIRTSRKYVQLRAVERSDGLGGRRAKMRLDRQPAWPIVGVRDLLSEIVSPDAVYPRTRGRALRVYSLKNPSQGDTRPQSFVICPVRQNPYELSGLPMSQLLPIR